MWYQSIRHCITLIFRKLRALLRLSPTSIPYKAIRKEDGTEKKTKEILEVIEKAEVSDGVLPAEGVIYCSLSALPCIDQVREELSCAICFQIFFEPSTTHCGHSFCKKCLKSAADKCGKRCPKCRQLICNTRSFPINTVLWNIIQLLFPEEVKARNVAVTNSRARAETTLHL
ncbi:uncharacterized protein LOC143861202 [Tasmannia lanceolata]|uniref:uncharacterized protein LOC143861202 n=1 Tax=Tasmannia lanceolata TaxID=3420 RepID=UPI0040642731